MSSARFYADGNVRSPLPPSSLSNLQMVGPEPVNTPAPAAVSLLDIMGATQKMANSAYGNVSDIHHVSETSTRRAEIEAGAEGKAVANLSRVTNVKDEDVTVVVKGKGSVFPEAHAAHFLTLTRLF